MSSNLVITWQPIAIRSAKSFPVIGLVIAEIARLAKWATRIFTPGQCGETGENPAQRLRSCMPL
jgi:hypothetical protein